MVQKKIKVKWKVYTAMQGIRIGFDEFESHKSWNKDELLDLCDNECNDCHIPLHNRRLPNLDNEILNADAGVSDFKIIKVEELDT